MRLNSISELQVIEVVSEDQSSWLYVNGKLKKHYSGYRLDLADLSFAINDYIEENSCGSYRASVFGINYQRWDINQEYAERGSLPELLKDIPEEMFE